MKGNEKKMKGNERKWMVSPDANPTKIRFFYNREFNKRK